MTYEKKTYNKPYKKSSRTENAHAYKSKRGIGQRMRTHINRKEVNSLL